MISELNGCNMNAMMASKRHSVDHLSSSMIPNLDPPIKLSSNRCCASARSLLSVVCEFLFIHLILLPILSKLRMSQFPEEALNLSSSEGFGYFPGYPGQKLNKDRYEISRKLGFGPRSSTWLVVDSQCVI